MLFRSHLLHWQADSLPLSHQESPTKTGCSFLFVNPLSGTAVEPWLSRDQHLRRKHLSPPSESQLVLGTLATILGSIFLSMSALPGSSQSAHLSLLASGLDHLCSAQHCLPTPCVKDTSRNRPVEGAWLGGGVARTGQSAVLTGPRPPRKKGGGNSGGGGGVSRQHARGPPRLF